MNKAPAFQWYAADYLADERVMLMSLEAEGAYVRLLSLCWREGSIPANAALLSAMCKQAGPKVIKEVLPCFTKAGAPSGRLVHKRLEEERAKQLAHRTKQAENGRNGGRPKKAMGNPNETQNNPPLFFGETQTKPNESPSSSPSSSFSFSSSIDPLPTVEGAANAARVEAEKKAGKSAVENLAPENLTIASRTKGGAADVGTRKPARFTPPTCEEILDYMVAQRPHNPPHDVERVAAKCFGYYAGNGWKVGKNPMKDWKGACQTFLADLPKVAPGQPPAPIQQPYRQQQPISQVDHRQSVIEQARAMIYSQNPTG